MNREDIFKLISDYFVKHFEVPMELISLSALLFDDLGLDSIDALDMIAMLEAEFNIEVQEQDMKKIKTVGDVIEYLYTQLGAAPKA